MKIEKLSDNQIRCTLNKADLAERELKISELAYGTEKAKDLFREMMQQASFEFGFDAEDIPLMIEAIPVSADCIILVITKVEDPEELDTRFSRFAPSADDDSEDVLGDAEDDDIASLFSKIQEIRDSIELNEDDIEQVEVTESTENDLQDDFIPFKESLKKESVNLPLDKNTETTTKTDAKEDSQEDPKKLFRVYSFNNFGKVSTVCERIHSLLGCDSALYKDSSEGIYYLSLTQTDSSNEMFNKSCSLLSEYGSRVRASYATESFYKEHYEIIIKSNAINILGNL